MSALTKDFEEHGAAAVAKVRDEKPADYLRVVASVIPKDIHLGLADPPFADLTDDQLDANIRAAAEVLGLDIRTIPAVGRRKPEDDTVH